jgi:DNA-binding transcriptional regulator YhcF (GntR family)
LKTITIDRTSSLPPWVQIKDQIKLAYCLGRLNEGDILPSIRALAVQLDVGEAIVRRVYQELTQSGFLSAEPRKHLMVTDTLTRPEHVEALTRECSDECDRLVEWARARHVSPTSLARLFLRQAMESTRRRPAYAYVDLGRRAADAFSEVISTAWEVPVKAMTFDDVVGLSNEELAAYAGIMVNYFRHEPLLKALDGRTAAIFPIRVRLHAQTIRKIKRQASGSSVLLVLAPEDAARVGQELRSYLASELGDDVRIQIASIDDIPDLAAAASDGEYGLLVVSWHIWDDIPEEARRLDNVVSSENEIIMESLERTRTAVGILV